jgi:predicted KAP-like P-loop ATPase
MFKPDQPIQSNRDDKLNRSDFAESLGEAILKYKEKDSIVVGLFGTWGSGKTSIINMALEHIDLASKNFNVNDKTIVTKFNPWNYSDQNQLVIQYFKHLSTVLQKPDYAENVKEAGRQLEIYANFFSPLKYIPGIGQYIAIAEDVLKSIGSATQDMANQKANDLETKRLDLNKLLSNQPHKIVVVIDDIDRLNNTEIRQIFQLIKSLGDFPNTIYLLAFDKNVVAKALQPEQKGTGLEYLEKMVQMPIDIPLISKSEVEKMLLSQLDEIIKDVPEDKWDKTYWGNIYQSSLKYFFNNIRDVTRYINSLKFSFDMIKEEVNPIDFIAITAIQVFIPDLYYSIRDNKNMFSGVYTETDRGYEAQEKKKERYNELFNQSIALPRETIINLLKIMFPKIEDVYGHSYYGASWMDNWRRDGRICSPDVFDTFFRLSIPKGEISQREITEILSHGNSSRSFAESLLRLNKEEKIARFLDHLEDYTKENIPEENIEPIITALMDVGDLFPEGDTGFLGFDTPMRIMRLIYQLIHRVPDFENRFSILRNAINNSQSSLSTAVHEVAIQNQEHGKYNSDDISEPEEKLTLKADHLTELEKLVCDKIEVWANDGRLAKHDHLIAILYSWKQWGCTEKVESFVEGMIETDDGLVDFIASFLNKVRSQTASNYVANIKWRININSVKEFVNIDDIEPRLRKIYHSPDYEKLADRKKLGIKTFIDEFDGKIKDPFPK